MTDFKHHWEVDADGYPTPRSLRSLRRYLDKLGPKETAVWLVHDFPKLVKTIEFPCVNVYKVENPGWVPFYRIEYSTAGWSGQESLIEVVLKSLSVRLCFYVAWRRGGHYTFEVHVPLVDGKNDGDAQSD